MNGCDDLYTAVLSIQKKNLRFPTAGLPWTGYLGNCLHGSSTIRLKTGWWTHDHPRQNWNHFMTFRISNKFPPISRLNIIVSIIGSSNFLDFRDFIVSTQFVVKVNQRRKWWSYHHHKSFHPSPITQDSVRPGARKAPRWLNRTSKKAAMVGVGRC